MPNWVTNKLTITGDQATLEKLQAQLNQPIKTHFSDSHFDKELGEWVHTPAVQEYPNPVFSFQNVIPIDNPETYYGKGYKSDKENIMEKIADEMANSDDWYHWNIRNWGTKWDISEVELAVADGYLSYGFQTAWSPVVEVVTRLAEQYPTLTFDYWFLEEQGWGGELRYEDGEVVSENEWDIPTSHEEWEAIGEECFACCSGERYADCPRETESV